MIAWCEYRQAKFNPQVVDTFCRPLRDDKQEGDKHFTVANERYSD